MNGGRAAAAAGERQHSNNEALARADEAHREAVEARHHVQRHEDRCEERWRAANETMRRIEAGLEALKTEIKADVAALYGRWWLIVLSVCAGLLSVIAALLVRYVLP